MKEFKAGFIAIVGRPNAGKSTLVNRLVGEKVSIVSWRPQTTRNKILGIINTEDYQIIFIDTPGIHRSKNKLSDYMMRSINNSLIDADAVVYVIDGTDNISDIDRDFLDKYSHKAPLIVALNKKDEAKFEQYIGTLKKLNEFKVINAVYPISARTGESVEELKQILIALMPQGARMYPDDIYTDRPMRFLVSEIIREKALKYLNEEIPYGISVSVIEYKEREDGLVEIAADIICERPQHKGIVIGKGGAMLKKIGEAARLDIEKLLENRAFLKLFVKVEDDWRDNSRKLEDLGYGSDTL